MRSACTFSVINDTSDFCFYVPLTPRKISIFPNVHYSRSGAQAQVIAFKVIPLEHYFYSNDVGDSIEWDNVTSRGGGKRTVCRGFGGKCSRRSFSTTTNNRHAPAHPLLTATTAPARHTHSFSSPCRARGQQIHPQRRTYGFRTHWHRSCEWNFSR